MNFSVQPDAIFIPKATTKYTECTAGLSNSVGNLGVKCATGVDLTGDFDHEPEQEILESMELVHSDWHPEVVLV